MRQNLAPEADSSARGTLDPSGRYRCLDERIRTAGPLGSEAYRLLQGLSDSRPDLDPRLVTLTEMLMEFGHQMIRLRTSAVAEGAPGYGVIAIRAMIRLGLVGPMSMGELASALSVSPARATQIVDALERAGHIERRRSDADRRVWQIRLKPSPAREVLEEEFTQPMAALRQAWAEVPEGCHGAVLRFVGALVAGMRGSEDECRAGGSAG